MSTRKDRRHQAGDPLKKKYGLEAGMIIDRDSIKQFLRRRHRIVLRSLFFYMVFSLVWIYTSDYFLFVRELNFSTFQVSLYKGWMFVIASTVFFYIMLRQRRLVYEKAIDTLDAFQEKLHTEAHLDALTRLPNREYLEQVMKQRISAASRDRAKIGLLYLNIDDFRVVNEMGSYETGNSLLCHVANTLQSLIRSSDLAVHLSADEFAVMLHPVNTRSELLDFSDRLKSRLRYNWQINGKLYYLSLSVGASMYPDHGMNMNELLQHAEMAMLNSKALGKNFTSFYYPGILPQATQLTSEVTRLREAIEENRLLAHYQPIFDLRSGKLQAVETLVRCRSDRDGDALIMPGDFIPLAESTGLIDRMTIKLIMMVEKQAIRWAEQNLLPPVITLNISSRQMYKASFSRDIIPLQESLKRLGSKLELEITESVLMEQPEKVIALIRELKTHGIQFALDDFGTGYSSLTWLRQLPVDRLKIDRQFIHTMDKTKSDTQILTAMINLAHTLGLQVVAEGIETAEQLLWLSETGCDMGQGYYLCRPNDPEMLKPMLANKQLVRSQVND